MKHYVLILLLLVGIALACCLARNGAETGAFLVKLQGELDGIHARLDSFENLLRAGTPASGTSFGSSATPNVTAEAQSARVPMNMASMASSNSTVQNAMLNERLSTLEEKLTQLLQRELQADYPDTTRIGESERRVAIQTIVGVNSTVSAKLAAHEQLRMVRDAYTPEAVNALVQLGLTSSDAHVRADVWRCFDGGSHLPQLVPHLMWALTSDQDPAPREEAADTLKNYEGDPQVERALEQAWKNDPSERVRQRALRSLGQIRRAAISGR